MMNFQQKKEHPNLAQICMDAIIFIDTFIGGSGKQTKTQQNWYSIRWKTKRRPRFYS